MQSVNQIPTKSESYEMAKSQHFIPLRPTLGLLTTVAELPHNYKIRYITPESPLDLTVKPLLSPMTPPPSPTKKRLKIDVESIELNIPDVEVSNPIKSNVVLLPVQKEVTPNKPIKSGTATRTSKVHPIQSKDRKHKAVRKLKFDENKSSPVSGTIIRSLDDIEYDGVIMESGDIDPEYNIVEVTEEAKSEIASIPNIIGSYACKLCRNEFEDAFGLARHKCSCIVLLEYRCPECGKRFNCPANLASHRRWHKPKDDQTAPKKRENQENDQQFPCSECGKCFKRQAYLRKHMQTHKIKQKTVQIVPRNSESSGSYKSDNSVDSIESGPKEKLDSDSESITSGYSSMPQQHFRLFESAFTEEENIAAAALAHLRNGPSVIRHTTALSV